MTLRTSGAGQHVRQYPLSRVACFALVASLTMSAACAGDSATSTSPTVGPSGQYELQTIDRVSLPARIYLGPGADPVTGRYYNQLGVVVNDGSVNFVSETQFAMVFNLTMTRDGVTRPSARYVDGKYERRGSDIVFHPENGFDEDFSGSFRNGVVSIGLDVAGNGGTNQYTYRQ